MGIKKQLRGMENHRKLKWQGMLLNEPVKMRREEVGEDKPMPQPKLDVYDLQLIQEELKLALKRRCNVIIHTWKDGKVTRHYGTILSIDQTANILTYADPFKDRTLNPAEIVSVNIVD
ncbi:YolD-like family protein [Planomicrobium chinense]|uniref:YolD-like family protein n=1 Tax=Planococcus chinensis TaxID=272917 RepID=UPI001CC46E0F|nr:YolD-like family protein [Planococcus chinensis]MBZ5201417.1 YolD-like family protein [Planococcus chinensis]